MKTTRKLAIAAAAVAALATASIATSGDAFARGGHGHGGGMRAFGGGGGKFIGGRHFGHHWRFRGYGYAYNTCWKWTPYGLVNVCRVLPY